MAKGRNENRPVPTSEHLIALFEAAASNARGLLVDAECLMGAESFARSHALAVLAEEELGKAKLCLVAALRPMGAGVDPREFWQEFYSHPGKLLRELSTQGLLDEEVSSIGEFVEGLLRESGNAHSRKIRGLYVDYQDGVILAPSDISKEEARQTINDARASLRTLNAACNTEGALNALRGMAGPGLEELFRKYVQFMAPDLDVKGWDADRLYQEIVRLVMADPDQFLRLTHELWGEFRSPAE